MIWNIRSYTDEKIISFTVVGNLKGLGAKQEATNRDGGKAVHIVFKYLSVDISLKDDQSVILLLGVSFMMQIKYIRKVSLFYYEEMC